MNREIELKLTPFLKWAGGKRWLVSNYREVFPQSYNNYIEPFLGGGAVFFNLNPKKGILSDKNIWLIDTYNAIKMDAEKVYSILRKHHKNHSKEYYYKIRSSKTKNIYTSAAKLIYLNRTCWNGLFRVNLKGEFNVPIGTKNNVIMENDNFSLISERLSNISIVNSDFEKIIDMSEENDLIFVDPPYTVKHDNNGFIKYNEVLFQWEDQIRLRDALVRAQNRGSKIILTNAHHSSISDLYSKEFKLEVVNRKSVMSSISKNRGKCEEYLIMNK